MIQKKYLFPDVYTKILKRAYQITALFIIEDVCQNIWKIKGREDTIYIKNELY